MFPSAVAWLPKHDTCRLVVVGAVEEAASSKGARHVIGKYHPECFIIGEPSQWQAVTLGYKGRLLIDYTLCHDMAHSAGQLASGPEIAVEFWNMLTRHAAVYNEGRAVFDTLDTSLRSMQTASDGLQEVVTQRIGLRLPLDYEVTALQTIYVNRQVWRHYTSPVTKLRTSPISVIPSSKRFSRRSVSTAAIPNSKSKPVPLI